MKKFALLILFSLICFPIFGEISSKGEDLEKGIWLDMKSQNWTKVDESIAPYFQSLHFDGARSKSQELALIKNLDLNKYTLSNFKVTEGNDVIVVSYYVSTGETIDNTRLSPHAEPHLSVWQNNHGVWQWVSHVNFNPISPKK